MRVKTIGNVGYVVTSAGICAVTADVNGTAIPLTSVGAGGGQAYFVAVGSSVEVSDAGAMVLPYHGTDVPLGMGGGVTAEQVGNMMETVLYDTVTESTRTPDGTDNFNATNIELAAMHVPVGVCTAIEIQCRSSSASQTATEAVYLTVYESNGSSWVRLGSSTNTVVQAAGSRSRWEFAKMELHGRALRFCLNTEPDGQWNTSLGLGVRVSAVEDGDTSKVNGYAYLADMTIETVRQAAKFTPLSHAEDVTLHLTAEEHAGLTALLAKKDELLALLG